MDKPTKPTNLMPRSFGGVKNNWSASMQSSGYEDGVPAIYGGDNLNYQLDATGKELDYCEKIADFISGIPIGKTITVDSNNKLQYADLAQETPIATTTSVGTVKPDGVTITIDNDGTIHGASADVDLSNLSSIGQNIGNWSSNVTNCITEIPQDIKLELNNNYLTIKAGTKGYLRSGSSDSITTQNDITFGPFANFPTSYFFVSLELNGSNYFEADAANCVSASSNPGTNYIIWYNTTEGKCYHNDGSGTPTECTFPIALLKVTNGIGITSIDQVFNGFGYIGSTVFALPGVKGLAPNGRNADGTLKNTEYALSQVWTMEGYTSPYTIVASGGINPCYYANYAAQDTKPSFSNGAWYNTLTNECYEIRDGVLSLLPFFIVGDVIVNNGKVVSFDFKKPLHLITYSDSDIVSGWSMPSDKYIDLTLGASDSTYTAPANGWVNLVKSASTGQYIVLEILDSNSNVIIKQSGFSQGGNQCVLLCPVQKGYTYKISYNASGTVEIFRFVYAQGSESEAS